MINHQKKIMVLIVLLSYFLLITTPALALIDTPDKNYSEMSLEELMDIKISSATFFEVDLDKTPGYVIHLDRDRISNSSARTIHDLFDQYVPGVVMSYHFFGSIIGHRGIQIDSNAKTQFMLDGKSLNFRHHMGYMLPLDVPLIGDLDYIDLIQGPGAILYGSGAINGSVNMMPKTGSSSPGFSVETEHGFIDKLYKLEVDYGKKYDDGDLYLYFGTFTSSGYSPDLNTKSFDSGSAAQTTTYNEVRDLVNGGGYSARRFKDDNYKFTLNWNHENFNLLAQYMTIHGIPLSAMPNLYQQQEDSEGTAIAPLDQNMNALWSHTHLLIKPSWDIELTDTESLDLTASVFMGDISNYDADLDRMVINGAHNQTSEIEYFFKPVFKTTRWDRHKLAIGMSFSKRYFRHLDPIFSDQQLPTDSVSYEWTSAQQPQGDYFNWLEYAFFAEDIFEITERLTASIGLRFDAVKYGRDDIHLGDGSIVQLGDTDYDQLLPRFSLVYELDKDSSIKTSYQKGFRHPDVANQTQPFNGAVSPETMDSYELNYSKKTQMFDRPASWDFNLFYNVFQDTIGWYTIDGVDDSGFSNMSEDYSCIGTELIGHFEPAENQFWNISYSMTRPYKFSKEAQTSNVMEVSTHRDEWGRYPEHVVKADVSQWFMDKRLLLHGSVSWTSAYPEQLGKTVNKAFRGGMMMIDLMAKYKIDENSSIKFVVKNLLEEENSRPAWSGLTSLGTIGLDERLFYVSYERTF